jgi:plasmid maintenance system antidote protein VapI
MTRKRGEKRQEVAVKIPITQAEMLQQLANELAAIALIKAEEALTGATAVKMANEAGWFLNLEAEVEKERAYTDDRIADSMRRRVARRNESLPSEDAEDDVPLFEQDEEVKDDFTGETEAAQANTNGDAAGTIPDLNDTGAGANKR